MLARTALGFLHSFDTLGVVFPSDIKSSFMFEYTSEQLQYAMENLRVILNKQFNLLATVCVLDPVFKPYPASLIASSILYVARQKLCLDPWPIHLQNLTRTNIQDCFEIIQLIDTITNGFSTQLTASMKTLTMTISPVKVPSTRNNEGNVPASAYQTPTIQRTHGQQPTIDTEDNENINPLKEQTKPARLQSNISPYSVTVLPSPLG